MRVDYLVQSVVFSMSDYFVMYIFKIGKECERVKMGFCVEFGKSEDITLYIFVLFRFHDDISLYNQGWRTQM